MIGGSQGKILKQKPWVSVFERLFSGSCLASFLVQSTTSCLGMVLPTVGWAFLDQLTVMTVNPPQANLNWVDAIETHISDDFKLSQVDKFKG